MRIDVDDGIEIDYRVWAIYRGLRCMGDVKLEGRCLMCLSFGKLLPAITSWGNKVFFFCRYCL